MSRTHISYLNKLLTARGYVSLIVPCDFGEFPCLRNFLGGTEYPTKSFQSKMKTSLMNFSEISLKQYC